MASRFQLASDAIALLTTKATFIGIRLLFLYLAAARLDRTEFGVLALAFTTAEICRYVGDWGTDNWSLRMFSHPDWKFAAAHLIWAMRLRMVSSVAASILAWFLIGLIAPQPNELRHGEIVLTVATSLWLNFGINWLQARASLKPAAIFTFVVGVACGAILIWGKINDITLEQQLFILISSEIFMSVGVLMFVRRQVGSYGVWKYEIPVRLAAWWKIVTPIAFATLVALAYSRLDQYFVSQTASAEILGDYTLAQRIVEPVLFISAAFASTIYVRASAFVHANGVSPSVTRYAWRWVGIIAIAALTICLLVGAIFTLFGLPLLPQYQDSVPFLWIALLCTVFRCVNLCLTAFIQALGKYNYIFAISMISAAAITAGVFVLGSIFGPIGAALGVCIGEALNTCIQFLSLRIIIDKK